VFAQWLRLGAIPSLLLWALPHPIGAQQSREQNEVPGNVLYAEKGCLGCHGASGRGAVGPTLAHTALSFEQFLGQLREPRGIMPPFHGELLNEAEARAIYSYLQEAPTPGPRIRQDLPQGEIDRTLCAGCHRQHNPTIVRQFEGSAMGRAGTQNARVDHPLRQLTCAECHGNNHDTIMATRGRVPEATCGACHAQIYKDHVLDAGHSYGPGPGDLGINWERNIGVPHYGEMPRAVMAMGCDPCHAQAGATDAKYWSDSLNNYIDTSGLTIRNGCIACHSRHAFDLAEARKPEACYTCHMGPDHPNYEAYMSSKHGALYVTTGPTWNWTAPMAEAQWDAPTCAYCHMLYVDSAGNRTTSHNMTRKIIWGMGVQAAAGQLDDLVATPDGQAKRNEMVRVCLTCHSEDKARDYLHTADAHKLAGDALVLEAQGILRDLYENELIEVSRGQRAAGLLAGQRFTAIDLPGGIAFHSPASLFYNVSLIEREYFDMFFFSNLKSYKGAFHMSPDYAWWYGYAEVLGHLATIRDEAGHLYEARSTRRRTLFMIVTGPIMVLAVLASIYAVWRWRKRRTRAVG
jgi:hydroxylamine dehydrogenase